MVMVAAMWGCGGKTPMPDAFVETIGGWHRIGVRDVPASQPPDAIPVKSVEAIRSATYEGRGKLEARIYALASSAVALDVVQRWTPSADTVFFYSDRFFVVVRWEAADRKALQAFVSELEKSIATPH
jgi:hypothetical protein